ncbi:hypothetical protein TNCV_2681391 [Trichonephila clavipes]|uniref:Uncharacterized protein n=1 Tax=Trichonephila clavipes TaxID=2585209 RepID=A0A8X6SDA4_TRICX|nr:hypothetical protein TNCV_2681391 [Trichonephila clavipes]
MNCRYSFGNKTGKGFIDRMALVKPIDLSVHAAEQRSNVPKISLVFSEWCSMILLPRNSSIHPTQVRWDLNKGSTLVNLFCKCPHFLEAPQQRRSCVNVHCCPQK